MYKHLRAVFSIRFQVLRISSKLEVDWPTFRPVCQEFGELMQVSSTNFATRLKSHNNHLLFFSKFLSSVWNIQFGISSGWGGGVGEGKIRKLDILHIFNLILFSLRYVLVHYFDQGHKQFLSNFTFRAISISDNNVYYRIGTYGNATLPGTGWQVVDGSFKKVAVGQDIVIGIDVEDNVFTRVGKVVSQLYIKITFYFLKNWKSVGPFRSARI